MNRNDEGWSWAKLAAKVAPQSVRTKHAVYTFCPQVVVLHSFVSPRQRYTGQIHNITYRHTYKLKHHTFLAGATETNGEHGMVLRKLIYLLFDSKSKLLVKHQTTFARTTTTWHGVHMTRTTILHCTIKASSPSISFWVAIIPLISSPYNYISFINIIYLHPCVVWLLLPHSMSARHFLTCSCCSCVVHP